MPGDIISQLVDERDQANLDNNTALVDKIDDLMRILLHSPLLRDISDKYQGQMGKDFNIGKFSSFFDKLEKLPSDITTSLSKMSDSILRNLMDSQKISRFSNLVERDTYKKATPTGKKEYIESAATLGSLADHSVKIFESVITSFEKEGKDFSTNFHQINDKIKKLNQYETEMLDEMSRITSRVPEGWKASETTYRRLQATKNLTQRNGRSDEYDSDAEGSLIFQNVLKQKGLTQNEKKRAKEREKEFNTPGLTSEERSKISKDFEKESKNFDIAHRSIRNLGDVTLGFDEKLDDVTEKMKEFCRGTPKGMMAVAFGIAFAAKELEGFIHNISGTIENMAELDIHAAHTKATFDSMFGSKIYDGFRKSMALTRKEMMEFSRTAMDAYRSSGVELERTMLIAENIRNQFGELDTGKLQEAVSIMSELTSAQTSALMGGGMGEDVANMYASLAKSRKAGRAADLLEQGVFGGDPLLESLNDKDKEIIKLQRIATRQLEDIAHWGKDHLTPGVQYLMYADKWLSKITPALSTIIMMMTATKFFGGNAGNIAGGFGKGSAALAAGLTVTSLVASGAGHFQNYFEMKAAEKEELRRKESSDIYSMTGLASSGLESGIDFNKVYARGAKYAKTGAWIGGGIGTILGAISGGSAGSVVPVIGTLGGGLAGGLKGGAFGSGVGAGVGYNIGIWEEFARQKGAFKGNVFVSDEKGNVDVKELMRIEKKVAESIGAQKQLVEFAKKEQKEKAASLRSIERTQIAIERVAKGMYTSNADANIAMAKRNIENQALVGGSSEAYGLNIASLMENNTKSFSTSMKILNDELMESAKQVRIDEESRLEKTREILTAQADVTQKFVETMNDSIGRYEKIPDVIVNNLKDRIAQMNLDFRSKTGGGTSKGNIELLQERLNANLDSFLKSQNQYVSERGDVEEARRQLDEVQSSLREAIGAMSEGSLPAGFNKDFLLENGRLDSGKIRQNQEAISRGRKELDSRILQDYGIDSSVMATFDKSLKPQEELNKLMNEIMSMKDEDFTDAKQKEFKEKTEKALRSMVNASNELSESGILGNSQFGRTLQVKAGSDSAALFELLGKLEQGMNKGISRENAKQMLSQIGSNNSAFTTYQEQLNRSKNDAKYREEAAALSRAETLQTMARSVSNSEVSYQGALSKQMEGLFAPLDKLVSTANEITSIIEQDPKIRLLQEISDINEKTSGWQKLNNKGTEYISKSLTTLSESIEQRERLAEDMTRQLDSLQSKYNKGLKESLEKFSSDKGTQDLISELDKKLTKLSEARKQAAENGDKQGLELVKIREAEIDSIKEQNKGNKEFMAVYDNLVSQKGAFDETRRNVIGITKGIKELNSDRLEKILKSIHEYQGEGRYRAYESRQGLASSQIDIYRMMNRSDMAQGIVSSRVSDARGKYAFARQRIMENYNENIQKYVNAGETPESARQIAGQEAQKALNEEFSNMMKSVVTASMDAYDIEKQRLGLIRESVDIQADYLSSIGAPFQEILRVEQMRVDLADKNYQAAKVNYENLVKAGASSVDKEKAKNELQRAAAEKMKAAYGAQNSALEKMFGNMIGAFNDIAGIIAPNNLAAKYGMGYTQGANGTVFNTGKGGPGLEGRKLAANFGVGEMTSEVIGSSTSIESISAASLDEEKKSNETLSDIKTSLDKISEKIVGTTPEEKKTPDEGKGATPKRKDAPKKVNDKIYEIKARWDKESQKVSQDAEGVKTVGSARARRKEIEEQAALGDQTSDAVSVDRMLRTADDLALSPIQAAESESEFDKYKRLQKESQEEKELLAKASSMTPSEAARRKAHNSYFNKTEKADAAQSGVAESSAIALEIKPATVTISFNSDMFEKKVIEIVGREIKKGTA